MLEALLGGQDEGQLLESVIDSTGLTEEVPRPITLGALSIELCRTASMELCQLEASEKWPISVTMEGVEFTQNFGFTGYLQANTFSAAALYLNGDYVVTIDGVRDTEGTVT